jgi:hypothetical protein
MKQRLGAMNRVGCTKHKKIIPTTALASLNQEKTTLHSQANTGHPCTVLLHHLLPSNKSSTTRSPYYLMFPGHLPSCTTRQAALCSLQAIYKLHNKWTLSHGSTPSNNKAVSLETPSTHLLSIQPSNNTSPLSIIHQIWDNIEPHRHSWRLKWQGSSL